jgi:queuine tRNA-ribosyltransferase
LASFLELGHRQIRLPVFLPDATRGVVRTVDAVDLAVCGVQALVMNVFHLMQRPGSTTIRSLGGIHKMYGWDGGIITDSGGFQAYSLIHANPKNGSITDRGLLFRGEAKKARLLLTPEKTIQLQLNFGSDLVICLDDCTHPDAPNNDQVRAVNRTIAWAKKCKSEYLRLIDEKNIPFETRPRIYAVIQGGKSNALREKCATALLEIGFDGFGYGGWPINEEKQIYEAQFQLLRTIIPPAYPLHALGVGHPNNIVEACSLGWSIFDSALPTRDARRGRLYAFKYLPQTVSDLKQKDWFATVYIADQNKIKVNSPVFEGCQCPTCRQVSTGFLHHLFKLDDMLYHRFATMHNLQFMVTLCDVLARVYG